MIIFYIYLFLCAEVTAVAVLINYISGTDLWITALIVLLSTLTYTLYGGLRVSIFTDNIQMIVIGILLLISFLYINSFISSRVFFKFCKRKNPQLFKLKLLTKLYSWINIFYSSRSYEFVSSRKLAEKVYAAKNNKILIKKFNYFLFIIVPIIFYMGFFWNGCFFNKP